MRKECNRRISFSLYGSLSKAFVLQCVSPFMKDLRMFFFFTVILLQSVKLCMNSCLFKGVI